MTSLVNDSAIFYYAMMTLSNQSCIFGNFVVNYLYLEEIMAESELLIHKLTILYMLKRVTFPMSVRELWSFYSEKELISESVFQETIRSLCDANLIHEEELSGVIRYELTKQGDEALFYFKNDVPEEITNQVEEYVVQNRFRLRNETGASTDYYKVEDGEYIAHLRIREGKTTIFEMRIGVPSEEQAKTLCEHLEKNAQKVYATVMRQVV